MKAPRYVSEAPFNSKMRDFAGEIPFVVTRIYEIVGGSTELYDFLGERVGKGIHYCHSKSKNRKM